MPQTSRPQGAFSWSGTLKETNIRALYERCQRLRLTGKMQLSQGDQVLELVWIGGEAIETESDQGTRSLPLWNDGSFKVEQALPDWKGHLTGSVELSGSLRAGQVQAIYKLSSDNMLSVDVDLQRASGEQAQVRFTLGKADSATISGKTESALSALSTLSSWTDGTFRVQMRPLFGDVQAAEAPVFGDKGRSDDQFDVTGSVDIAKGNIDWPPKPRENASVGQPVPMGQSSSKPAPGMTAAATGASSKPAAKPEPAAAATASPPSSTTPGKSSRLASTLVSVPGNVPSSSLPTQPMTTMSRQDAQALVQSQVAQAQPAKSGSLGRTLMIASLVVILLCGLVIAAVLFLKNGGGSSASQPPVTFVPPAAATLIADRA
jgi:hypothetical protein